MLFASGLIVAQSSAGGFSIPGGPTAVLLAGIAALALSAVLFALLGFARRQERRDLREVQRAVEDLRSGAPARRADVPSGSAFGLLADSVQRLAHETAARRHESEAADARLRALLLAAHDYAVVVTDADGDVRSFRGSAEALFGWEEEELLGRPADALFDETAFKDLLPRLSRRAFRERGVELRTLLKRKDGSTFNARVSVRWVEAPGAGPPGFLMLAKDVEDEVRLESELRDSEARYRALFEASADGTVLLQKGAIRLANPAFAGLSRLQAPALLGRPLRDLVGTRDMLVVNEQLERLESGAVETAEASFTLLGENGAVAAEVRMLASAVKLAGEPAVLATFRDETAERMVEAELRGNETRLDAVIEAASDGIIVIADSARGGFVRMTNRAFLDLFGLAERDVLGVSEGDLLRLLHKRGGGAQEVAAFLAAATRGEHSERVTLEGERPVVLELRASALVGRGTLLGRVLACRDVTDLRAFEERLTSNAEALRESRAQLEASHAQLQALNEEILRRASEGERLNHELRALVEMKTNLLATVSHELQTPLVSIRGYTEMILRERLGAINEEQRKGLQLSLQNIDRLISMIDSLLTFATSQTSAEKLAISEFRLSDLVEETAGLLREQAARRGIQLEVVEERPGLRVQADRDQIHRVFVNLLSNGIKYNREGGSVVVRVGRGRPGFVRVRVEDTGVGIPQEERERIFDRGHRGTPAELTGRAGHGIGLAVVRDILRMHGGSIHVSSTVGRGTSFEFSLSAAEADAGYESAPPPERTVAALRPEAQSEPPRNEVRHDPAAAKPPEGPLAQEEPQKPAAASRPRFRIIRSEPGSKR